jgi:hypothetical protein
LAKKKPTVIALIDADYLELPDLFLTNGYPSFKVDGETVYLHRLVAERAFGAPLPAGAEVHHFNENKLDARRNNLVICNSRVHHLMLHARARIVDRGGDPDTQKICCTCNELLTKEAFTTNSRTWDGRHPQCRECANAVRRGKGYNKWTPERAEYQRQRREAQRGQA